MQPSINWTGTESVDTIVHLFESRYGFTPTESESLPCRSLDRCCDHIDTHGSASAAIRVVEDVVKNRILFLLPKGLEDSYFTLLEYVHLYKHVFEVCLRNSDPLADRFACGMHMIVMSYLHHVKHERCEARCRNDEDPLVLIEQQFFGDVADKASYLHGALLLTFYRNMLLKSDSLGFVAALFAFREAYGFYIGGAAVDAREAADWALQFIVVAKRHVELDQAQSHAIGLALLATARGAQIALEFDDQIHFLQSSLRYVRPTGDDGINAMLELVVDFDVKKVRCQVE